MWALHFVYLDNFLWLHQNYTRKALEGIFSLKGRFGSSFPNSSVAFHIFDHTIKPILTYGCEIRASMSKSVRSADNIFDNLYQNIHEEKLHIKFCKYVLSVHSKALYLACVGEAVGNQFTLIFVTIS